jgi:hypothetical protein
MIDMDVVLLVFDNRVFYLQSKITCFGVCVKIMSGIILFLSGAISVFPEPDGGSDAMAVQSRHCRNAFAINTETRATNRERDSFTPLQLE